MNIKQFVNRERITMVCDLVERNPHIMADDTWARWANHFKCVLRKGRARMTVFYSMGPALAREPKVDEVLDTLASDAAGYENSGGDFEAWASEYGFGIDSHRAEKSFRATATQNEKLKNLLGPDVYKTLVWHVERL